jgi:hypothetical protein
MSVGMLLRKDAYWLSLLSYKPINGSVYFNSFTSFSNAVKQRIPLFYRKSTQALTETHTRGNEGCHLQKTPIH